MKLLYDVKYNHNLDVAYQRGESPSRYGLTRGQVEELKQAGQWEKFFARWKSLRLTYLSKHYKLCIACNKDDKHAMVILGQRICRECCKDIKRKVAQ